MTNEFACEKIEDLSIGLSGYRQNGLTWICSARLTWPSSSSSARISETESISLSSRFDVFVSIVPNSSLQKGSSRRCYAHHNQLSARDFTLISLSRLTINGTLEQE